MSVIYQTHDQRGIPLWLLHDYLQGMGGVAVDEVTVRAPHWEARLERLEPFRLGSLAVGQVRLHLRIEEAHQAEFWEQFRKKTLRAGA